MPGLAVFSCRTLTALPLEAVNLAFDPGVFNRQGPLYAGRFAEPVRHERDVAARQAKAPGNAALEVARKFRPESVAIHLSCEAISDSVDYRIDDNADTIRCQHKNHMAAEEKEPPLWPLRLRALKAKLGYTRQSDFAAALDTRQGVVSTWLSGESRPVPEAFIRIAKLASGEDRVFFLKEAGIPMDASLGYGLGVVRIDKDRAKLLPTTQLKKQKDGRSSRPAPESFFDPDLLMSILESINTGLRKRGEPPPPAHARTVLNIYRICLRNNIRDRESIAEICSGMTA
jgi:transcriptional regulator with XRE-family HTH domain